MIASNITMQIFLYIDAFIYQDNKQIECYKTLKQTKGYKEKGIFICSFYVALEKGLFAQLKVFKKSKNFRTLFFLHIFVRNFDNVLQKIPF